MSALYGPSPITPRVNEQSQLRQGYGPPLSLKQELRLLLWSSGKIGCIFFPQL